MRCNFIFWEFLIICVWEDVVVWKIYDWFFVFFGFDIIGIGWNFFFEGNLKLNVDGWVKGCSGFTGVDGVVRDVRGNKCVIFYSVGIYVFYIF